MDNDIGERKTVNAWLRRDEFLVLHRLAERTSLSKSRILRALVQWYAEMEAEDEEEALRRLAAYVLRP